MRILKYAHCVLYAPTCNFVILSIPIESVNVCIVYDIPCTISLPDQKSRQPCQNRLYVNGNPLYGKRKTKRAKGEKLALFHLMMFGLFYWNQVVHRHND